MEGGSVVNIKLVLLVHLKNVFTYYLLFSLIPSRVSFGIIIGLQ